MKQKRIIGMIVLLIIIILCVYFLTRPKVLGNINKSYKEPATTTAEVSFSGEAGGRIKFSFRSDIKNGDLEITLNNSKGQTVYQLDEAKSLETFYTLDHADTYTLTAACSDFTGEYKIRVMKAD